MRCGSTVKILWRSCEKYVSPYIYMAEYIYNIYYIKHTAQKRLNEHVRVRVKITVNLWLSVAVQLYDAVVGFLSMLHTCTYKHMHIWHIQKA